MVLKAKHPKSFYKNENYWLNAIYRNNKQLLDKLLTVQDPRQSTKRVFKKRIMEYKQQNYTLKQSVKLFSKSEVITSKYERLQQNLRRGLSKFPLAMKEFRKKIGWKTKIDPSKFVWNREERVYQYEGTNVRISVKNSPFNLIIM